MQFIPINTKSILCIAFILIFQSFASRGNAQTATISAANVYQTIDGFGAASNFEDSPPLTSAQAQLFFSTSPGVGLGYSLLREEVNPGIGGDCLTVNSGCLGANITDFALAASYGVRIWATPWSPPATYKTNGSIICDTGSGGGSLNPGNYGAYATYLSNYVASVAANGQSLYAISVQNEPDQCPTTYDGAVWTDSNFDSFIKNNLGPVLATASQTGTKVMLPEPSQSGLLSTYADTTMGDPSAAQYVSILAFHGYDNSFSISNPYASTNGFGGVPPHFWETEVSSGPGIGPDNGCDGCFNPSMSNALMWANIINYNLSVANESAWNYWALIGRGNYDYGLWNNGVVSKRAYVIGNWSLFVRPGWVRIGATATPQTNVQVSAFENPLTGAFAIVAINSNGNSVSQQYSLSGLSASEVTPYITDPNNNLASQSAVPVSGGSFTSTLTASSVTTFVGSGSGPAAPSHLIGTTSITQ